VADGGGGGHPKRCISSIRKSFEGRSGDFPGKTKRVKSVPDSSKALGSRSLLVPSREGESSGGKNWAARGKVGIEEGGKAIPFPAEGGGK